MNSSDALHQRELFERAPIGFVEVELDGAVLYANPKALDILGATTYTGMAFHRMYADQDLLEKQLSLRRRGLVGNYRAHLIRQADGEKILVDITAIPVIDASGEVTSSVAMFRYPLEEEINRIHQEGDGADSVLYRVMVEVCKVIPCDLVTCTRFSEDLRHSQPFFTLKPRAEHGRVKWRKAWQLIPPVLIPTIADVRTILFEDVQARMEAAELEPLRKTPTFKELIKEKVQVAIRRVVLLHGKPFASVTFYSTSPDRLTHEHQATIDELPIAASVIQAIEFFDRKRESERFKLLKEVGNCPTIEAVYETLVRRLHDMFGWTQVSIYRTDHSIGRINLQAQCVAGEVLTNLHHVQDLDKGVLGRAVRTSQPQLVEDTRQDPDYLESLAPQGMLSEMCWPVMVEDETKVRWIIDVEDARLNAFSEEERCWLGEVAGEVGGFMKRLSTLHFLSECLSAASDAIVVTDVLGRIKRANPAAAELFGASDPKNLKGDLVGLFADADAAHQLLSQPDGQLGEVNLRRLDDGAVIAADVSRRLLPEDIGGAIYMFKDMRLMRRALELVLLEQTAYEVAIETRTPLTIAISELERAGRARTASASASMERSLRYLYRAQHAFAKLAMFNGSVRRSEFPPEVIDLGIELRALCSNLPPEMGSLVQLEVPGVAVRTVGDAFQIAFVLETLLIFLARHAPEEVPVQVSLSASDDRVLVRFEAAVAIESVVSPDSNVHRSPAFELRLSYPLIQDYLARNDATFELGPARDGQMAYVLSFKTAA